MGVAVALLGAGVATASAANTRVVVFGSPGTPGVLTYTPVTVGGRTAVDVVIANAGGQTLTHVALLGGALAEQASNPQSPPPAGPSLPAGASYAASYPLGACSISGVVVAGDSIACPIGTLVAGASVTLRIVIAAPPAVSTSPGYSSWLSVHLDEGTSSDGANTDTFFAAGPIAVGPASCDSVSSYFLDTEAVVISNQATATPCVQATTIAGPTFSVEGAFASVGTQVTTAATACLPGYSCFGLLSLANVNDGQMPSGTFVTWDIVWSSTLYNARPKGFIHFLDQPDPLTGLTYAVISFQRSSACATASQTNCWVALNATSTSFEAIVRTPSNGSGRGF